MNNNLKHQPKGSMCMACVKQRNDCSTLDFTTMPVLMRLPAELGGAQVVVRCTQFEAGTRAECSNVIALPVKSPLEQRHGTTPEQMRAMVRDLSLWMHDQGVEHFTIQRKPGTAQVLLTIDGRLAI